MPIYLKLGKIEGGVTAADHDKWISISSLQWGAGRGISSPVGESTRREASAPSISEFTLTKDLDGSSYMLLNEAVVGKGTDAKIHFMRSEGDNLDMYLEYSLTDAMVSSYSVSSGGEVPSESLALNFTKLEMRYLPTKADGALGSAVTAGYDLATGKKI